MAKKNYPQIVFLNNQWLPHDQAFVSVFDRGFLFGDGIYEVIPFYAGQPFTLEAHLSRMQEGLNLIGINFKAGGLAVLVQEAVERAGLALHDSTVYIQVTRGVAPRAHAFPEETTPTVLMYASPFDFSGFEERLITVGTTEDIRWHRCNIKSVSLIANVQANEEAYSQGFSENLLIRDGWITEGSHSSVFVVRDGMVYTHPLGSYILPGITREVVVDICKELGIPLMEEAVHVDDLGTADELFLSGTTTQVLAIGSVVSGNARHEYGSTVGSITKQIQRAFINRTKQATHGQSVFQDSK